MRLNDQVQQMIDEGKTPDEVTDYIIMLKDREEAKYNRQFVDRYADDMGVCAMDMYVAALHSDAIIPLCFMLTDHMLAIRS